MNILLCCSGGMSTSMLVNKMRAAAKESGIEAVIEATSKSELEAFKEKVDIVLLGPQIRFAVEEVKQIMGGGIPVDVIDTIDYGTMNGKKVLSFALNKIEGK